MAFTGLTYGRRLLLAVLGRTTACDVAARCRVPRRCVSHWAAGTCKPRMAARQMLQRNYRIPVEAWDSPLVTGAGDRLRPNTYH